MVWLRGGPLLLALIASACTGSPTESQTSDASGDDDDDDDADDDDDDTSASDDDTSATDPSGDPDTADDDDATDATDPDTTGSTSGTVGESSSGVAESSSDDGSVPTCHPQLNEIAFDVMGDDDGLEWIAITSPCDDDIEMSDYALGWGGVDYTYGMVQLEGTLSGHGCFVVGGPTASQTNYSPAFAQSVDLEFDLQNPDGTVADGIALFLGPVGEITPDTVPVDAVVYGESNRNELLDPDGEVATPAVSGSNDMQTIARAGDEWVVNVAPSPNDCTSPM